MDIVKQATWLKGFLESLTYSDSISKGQIELLKKKLEELIISLEETEHEDYDSIPPSVGTKKLSYDEEPLDDLPF